MKKFAVTLGIFVILIISAIFSVNPFAAIYGIFKFSEFLLLGIFISSEIKIDRKIIFLFVITVIYESLIAIAQFLNQASLNSFFYFLGERMFTGQTPGIANASINGELVLRPYGTFSHPNVLAGFLVIEMIFLLFYFFKQNKKQKIYILSALIIGTIALFITLSRVAIILWIFLALFIILKKNRIDKKITYVFFGVFMLFIFLFFNTHLFQRFSQIDLTDEAFTQRQTFLREASSMFLKHPLVGVGINNFIPNIPYIDRPSGSSSLQPVHNIFALNLVETGIVGFIAFLTFLFYTIRKISKKSFLILCLISIFFLGLFDHYFLTLQQGQLLLTLVLGLCLVKK
jgi:O-antigen ligase